MYTKVCSYIIWSRAVNKKTNINTSVRLVAKFHESSLSLRSDIGKTILKLYSQLGMNSSNMMSRFITRYIICAARENPSSVSVRGLMQA